MKYIFIFLFVVILFIGNINAESFILKDGSIIVGELISYSNGIYKVHTNNFGDVKIKKNDIVRMNTANNKNSSKTNSPDLNNALKNISGILGDNNSKNSDVNVNDLMKKVSGMLNKNGAGNVDVGNILKGISVSGNENGGKVNVGGISVSGNENGGKVDVGGISISGNENGGKVNVPGISNLSSLAGNSDMKGIMNIVSSPEFMKQLIPLFSDPSIRSLVTDPKIIEAIGTKNFDSLLKNSKFLKLLTNPKIKNIVEQVKNSLGN